MNSARACCRTLLRSMIFFLIGFWLTATVGNSPAAADGPAASVMATNIAQVNAILRDPTQTNEVRARFRGTVIYLDRRAAIRLQEGSAGVIARLPSRAEVPRLLRTW